MANKDDVKQDKQSDGAIIIDKVSDPFLFHYTPNSISLKLDKAINVSQNIVSKSTIIPNNTDFTFSFDLYFSEQKVNEKDNENLKKNTFNVFNVGFTSLVNNTFANTTEIFPIVSTATSVIGGVIDTATGVASLLGIGEAESTGIASRIVDKIKILTKAYTDSSIIMFAGNLKNIAHEKEFIIKSLNIDWMTLSEKGLPLIAKISISFVNIVSKYNLIRIGTKEQ